MNKGVIAHLPLYSKGWARTLTDGDAFYFNIEDETDNVYWKFYNTMLSLHNMKWPVNFKGVHDYRPLIFTGRRR